MKLISAFFLFFSVIISAQEIPINKFLYPTVDFEFKISYNGDYMASIKKFPSVVLAKT
jgi:hypothetical protein